MCGCHTLAAVCGLLELASGCFGDFVEKRWRVSVEVCKWMFVIQGVPLDLRSVM
jgi:hypothetical protein